MQHLPQRKRLPHEVPDWVSDGEIYFITINCRDRGINQLAHPQRFRNIHASAEHYTDKALWHVRLMVIMPDHLHSLITLNTRAKSIPTIIGGWKRYLAKSEGIQWQKSYFEHRIRNRDELTEKETYLMNNPVRAGLCEDAEDWPYCIRSEPRR